jgi:predicted nucleic acid-binding protein
MTHGIDTDFLVAVEVRDHPFHEPAVALLSRLLDEGHDFALAPQTLAEFLHVVTDSKRMPRPLEMAAAIARAAHWWQAAEVIRVFPDAEGTALFLDLLREHRLGRKRLLDTQLAATFRRHGIRRILSNNASDYLLFAGLEVVSFR